MPIKYPETPIRPVIEQVHGHEILDQYQWLEDVEASETKVWTDQQNQLMRKTLDGLPIYQRLKTRLEELYDVEQVGTVKVAQDRVFYMRKYAGQNQPVLCYRLQDEEGTEQIILDPNKESDKGTVALSFWYPSRDGQYLAYGFSPNGEEWAPIQILNIETGEVLQDQIPRTRYPSVSWKGNTGFYYTRHPEVGEVPTGEENYHPKIYFHQLGDDYRDDQLIYGEDVAKNVSPWAKLTKDEQYLLLFLDDGWRRTRIFATDLSKEVEWKTVIDGYDGLFYGELVDEKLYLLTNYESPNYRVVALDLKEALDQGGSQPEDWQTIIPEQENLTLQSMNITQGRMIVSMLKDASFVLKSYKLDGSDQQEIPLPQLGSLGSLDCSERGDVYFTYQSFIQPLVMYRHNVISNEMNLWAAGQGLEGLDHIQIEQHFYQSKDGTRVPMFVMHRKDLNLDGPQPTVLFGYGGFNISLTPNYHPGYLAWIEAGGILAIANLRGGSEYGESWHRAGMLDQKQNVFDDFIWAGKYLTEKGYTDAEHLGIYGRSNGGLLVGATMTQAPEMMRAVVCQVPLLDMVRYHKFLAGAFWIGEYGDPENPEEFEWVYDYSPYHHVKEGEKYPGVFFVTALSDTRVHPLHAMKMAAAVQKASNSGHPVLLKVEAESGHGAGKPTSKMVEEQADIWSFMAWQLGL